MENRDLPAFPITDAQQIHRIANAATAGIEKHADRERAYVEISAKLGMGMTKREHLIANAPITLEMAVTACGFQDSGEALRGDVSRTTIFAVWALMCAEWSDAILHQLEGDEIREVRR